MNILFFHSTIWNRFFSELLLHYQEKYHARVTILCPRAFQSIYGQNEKQGAAVLDLPDLLDRRPFEKHARAGDEVQSLISACESSAGRSANRILLAAERDMGHGFSRGFFHWPQSSIRRFCARDNRRPNLLLLRLFAFMNDVFREAAPDLVLSRETASRFAQAAWFLAALKDIPFFTCRFSKVLSKRAFWTDDYFMYNTRASELAVEYIAGGRAPSREAMEMIKHFRGRPSTVDYILQNWIQDKAYNWFKTHWDFLALTKQRVLYHLRGSKGARPKHVMTRVFEYYRTSIMKRRHARYFRTFREQDLRATRYAYLALHKEPELMINFESPLWHDQRHLIKYVSSMLPSGCRLLVKEHRFNWGRRYGGYLKYISGLPNVTLINPFDNQFKYIKNADIIVTDNGSTGWEGLIMKKSVVTLEKTFYDAAGVSLKAPDPRLLDRVLLDALENRADPEDGDRDSRLAALIDAERETSLDIQDMHAAPELSVREIDRLMARRGEGLR